MMRMRAFGGLLLLTAAVGVQAAGGHHAVDDAALLEPGQCGIETWIDRDGRAGHTLWHLGPACRVGAVELGLNLDRIRSEGVGRALAIGPQLKWATPPGGPFSVGFVIGAAWRDDAPHFAGATLLVPLSWQLAEPLLLHVNVGRDLRPGQPDLARGGIALEWTPRADWSFVGERFHEREAGFARLGARWQPSPAWSIDLSRARGAGAEPARWWTLGLTVVISR